jgi:hypothetical protein
MCLPLYSKSLEKNQMFYSMFINGKLIEEFFLSILTFILTHIIIICLSCNYKCIFEKKILFNFDFVTF